MRDNTIDFDKKKGCPERSCLNCTVRRLSFFADLNQKELAFLNRDRTVANFQRGAYIYRQGTRPTGLICLTNGKVKIVADGVSGNEQILSLKKPVEFLGFSDLMRGEVHACSAIALEETITCNIPANDFLTIVRSNLALSQKIIKHLSDELVVANQRTIDLTQKHMRARLADSLLLVHETYRKSDSDFHLNVDLKRSDWAGLSNMTTANAIRTLSEFSKSGIVHVDGRSISISNLQELRRISISG